MYEYGIDLHVHSNYSDGEMSPKELLRYAYKTNISTIAITDHDTVMGLKSILHDYGHDETKYVTLIPGIELTAQVNKGRMHILGYGINVYSEDLNLKLNEIRDNNINYIILMLAQIKKDYGIQFSYDEIKVLINSNHNLNRVDIARLCVDNGYVDSVQEAFDKYLIDAYKKIGVGNKGILCEECIDLIKNSGGLSVLAHPKSLELNNNELYKKLYYLKGCGLDGIEVYHSSHNIHETEMYLEMANELGLLVSGGSDFHGKYTKPNVMIGKINGEYIKRKELSIVKSL